MDIKKLFIAMMFVVGLTPNNMRSACKPCQYAEAMQENNGSQWRIITEKNEQDEEDATEPLIEFVAKHGAPNQCAPLPNYASRPANVSFHKQIYPCSAYEEDPYAPCDTQFQEKELQELQEEEAEQPYIVIYKVK